MLFWGLLLPSRQEWLNHRHLRARKYPICDRCAAPRRHVRPMCRVGIIWACRCPRVSSMGLFLETDLRSRCIEVGVVRSRGKRYLIAADAGGERVKPLVVYGQPYLVWLHRGCYIRTTRPAMSNTRSDSNLCRAWARSSCKQAPLIARNWTRLSRVKLICDR